MTYPDPRGACRICWTYMHHTEDHPKTWRKANRKRRKW